MPVTEAISFLLNESPLIDRAIAHFGLTDDPNEAGYILPDGRMLDLSGKNDGGTPGVRSYDHRDATSVLPASDSGSVRGQTDGMVEFMRQTGAVRFSAIGTDVTASAAVPMTDAQIAKLTALSRTGSYFLFDLVSNTSMSAYDIEIDFVGNRGEVRRALVDINKRFGGR